MMTDVLLHELSQQACIHSIQPMHAVKLPAQMMLDHSTLKTRIHRILKYDTMEMSNKKTNDPVKKITCFDVTGLGCHVVWYWWCPPCFSANNSKVC